MVQVPASSERFVSRHCLTPDQVVIVGGGRWARVIAGVVCDLLSPGIPLTLCSPRGADSLSTWVTKQGLDKRIIVAKQLPAAFPSGRTAVIVANAARDHVNTGLWALQRGAAVLIEKPLALSLQGAQDLADCAKSVGGLLASAHVLRFTRYLPNFASMLPPWEDVCSVNLDWVDPAEELRWGESKQYDPSVPVFMDCLPHAVSVLQSVFGLLPELAGPPIVEAGGARVTLPLLLGDRICRVILQRNGPRRLRRISVDTLSGTSATLDFSVEPGVIRLEAASLSGDPRWDAEQRPLASLLEAFLIAAAGGGADSRLSLDTAFSSCAIADAVMPHYRTAILSWLSDRLISANESDDAIRYALAEILSVQGGLAGTDLLAWKSLLRELLRNGLPALKGIAAKESG